MKTPRKTVALLIDGDNIPLKYTKQIIQFCKGYGVLIIKHAYGDWKKRQLSPHYRTIAALDVNVVQQNRDGKNATDRAMKKGITSTLANGNVDIYIIVSGDGHFKPDCERIIKTGAQVIGIGIEKNTSKKLLKVCDDFRYIQDIIKNSK